MNWRDIYKAILMIEEANDAGCWASKFQLFTEKEAPNLPKHLYLTKDQAEFLFNYGEDLGIEVFFTPMFAEAVDWCEDIGVSMYKIRHKDRYNFELINKITDLRKPTFMSIEAGENHDKYAFDKPPFIHRCIPLLVVPKYPADLWDYISAIPINFWEVYQGISDHTSDLQLLKEAQKHNVGYFEKHVKLDDNCLESAWSVTFEQLAEVLK